MTETTHPVYTRAQSERARRPEDRKVYLTTAEVAKLLRERLKREFPGARFSVRSNSYAGGSSIDICWTGGPPYETVDAIAKQYEFSGFDGMIDMQYGKDRWLLPDGTLTFAGTRGTQQSAGLHPAEIQAAPSAEALRVGGGPDFVFCRRDRA